MTESIPPTPPVPPTTMTPPMANYSMPPTGKNGYAVASLVCSLAGFCVLFVGGILGVIFGIMGLRRARETGGGSGLATAGLIVGIISLLASGVSALMFGGFYVGFKSVMQMGEAPHAVARQYMTDLSQGKVDAALAQAEGISHDEATSQAAALQQLGAFRDMTSSSFNIVNSSCVLTGQAQFAKGTQNYTITLTGSGANWKVTGVQLR